MSQVKYTVESTIRVKPKKKRTERIYLTWKEKVELMKECGDAAVILLEFFFSKSGMPDYVYTDKKSAKALGWTISKVRFVRTKLQKAGYYHMMSARHVRSRKRLLFFYLGKDEVSRQKTRST